MTIDTGSNWDMTNVLPDPDATYLANIATMARWAEQMSDGFFTVTDRHGATVVRSDGEPLGTPEGWSGPTTGAALPHSLYIPSRTKLNRRHRTLMKAVYVTVRHIMFSDTPHSDHFLSAQTALGRTAWTNGDRDGEDAARFTRFLFTFDSFHVRNHLDDVKEVYR